jgi:IclR family transcriptional regulator, acetate operon repressor
VTTTPDDRYRVQSVERAVFVLGALGDAGPDGLTLSQLSRALGASKSSTFAILQTLLGYGFVADSGSGMSRRYRLGLALARLGDLVVSQIALRDVSLPVLRELTQTTGLTSRVAVLEAPYAVVIGRVDAEGSAVRFATNLFKRELMHCSAVGKAMLAVLPEVEARGCLQQSGMPQKTRHTVTDIEELMIELADVRPKGYFLDDEEDADGVCCIGAPIVVDGAACAGAISVTGLKVDVPAWRLHQIGEHVRDHAERIASLLSMPQAVPA